MESVANLFVQKTSISAKKSIYNKFVIRTEIVHYGKLNLMLIKNVHRVNLS